LRGPKPQSGESDEAGGRWRDARRSTSKLGASVTALAMESKGNLVPRGSRVGHAKPFPALLGQKGVAPGGGIDPGFLELLSRLRAVPQRDAPECDDNDDVCLTARRGWAIPRCTGTVRRWAYCLFVRDAS